MATRKTIFATGEQYHVYGRGNDKQTLFHEKREWARFLFLILYFQGTGELPRIDRVVERYVKGKAFDIKEKYLKEVLKNRVVELLCFALMPNHFHLILKEVKEDGVSNYMQRVLTAYAMYFNTKHDRTGHVFQGPFGASHMRSNEQLLYTSAYIHRNPRELIKWKNKEQTYPWSSFQDYVEENRWNMLLLPNSILGQFGDGAEYKKFVDTSGAKELEEI